MAALAEEQSIFENEDWLVTDSGLEHKTTGYFIARESLADRRGDGLWSWPLHMAEKSWCRMAPFTEAFSCAAAVYGVETDLDLAHTFKIARCEIATWPQPEKMASNPAPSLLRTLRPEACDPILVEQGYVGKATKSQAFQTSDENWRKRGPKGIRSFPTHARLYPSRFDPTRATSFGWKAPRIRRTGTKLVQLIQAAWNIK
ncbi:hypothetical protein [Microvirga sp. 2TAF3]|uniref:hypothetical protein n=1 Tax=Microvirga sp. 2TAF3 TaxID=3233014 RepID=UPI003F97AED5